ncbi:head-tail joining protein [Sphingomonas sp. 3-13AW]|uniref:head-tail joining protein n=1 Tax=Sphingomonas sp. 3-13AW TaxID=3050450 RepID=UPI003BB6103A
MDPFAPALDALFHGPGSEAADYVTESGVQEGVRVIRSRPTADAPFGDSRIRQDTCMIDVRRSEVPAPAAGDRFLIREIDPAAQAEVLTVCIVTGDPALDVERMTWTCEAPEA